MLDIVNYFIGAMHRLFFYVNNDWANNAQLVMLFVACVALLCAITLWGLFACVKCAISALFNALFKGE